jgi:hypothetical protein
VTVAEPSGDKKKNAPTSDRDTLSSTDVTREVGSEGGSPGDVELDTEFSTGTGSEAGETLQPTATRIRPIVRDETGVGRRSS